MMLQFLYGGEEEEVENAIQENMIEVDAVTNDLRKKSSLLKNIVLTYKEDILGPRFAYLYKSHGLLKNINVWL